MHIYPDPRIRMLVPHTTSNSPRANARQQQMAMFHYFLVLVFPRSGRVFLKLNSENCSVPYEIPTGGWSYGTMRICKIFLQSELLDFSRASGTERGRSRTCYARWSIRDLHACFVVIRTYLRLSAGICGRDLERLRVTSSRSRAIRDTALGANARRASECRRCLALKCVLW